MSISMDALKGNTRIWESLGPVSSGGTVFGLAISPIPEVSRYFAATGCGIFYSDDAGKTWKQNLTGLSTPLLSALTIAPNGALFTGALGGDVFASYDFGRTWEQGLVPAELKATVTVMATSPSFRRDGTAFAATDGGGLLATRNSGSRWEDSSFGLGNGSVVALATAPDWARRETMFAATTEGVFVSINGGRAWRETELMMDDDVVDVLALSPAFDRDRTVYAGTEAGKLYRSTDAGRTWDLLQEHIGEGPVNTLWLGPDYGESGRVIAGVGARLYRSMDGGDSWTAVADLPGVVLALTGNDEVILAGLHDAGIYKSTDGGETWVSSSEGLAARGFARMFSDDQLYVMGPQEGLWLLEEGGSWKSMPGLDGYMPLTAFSLTPEGTLFVASQEGGILRSKDRGQSWESVCAAQGVQTLLVLSDKSRGWAGTADGQLWVTADGGATWQDKGSPSDGQEVLSIVASPDFATDQTVLMGTSIPATGNKQARVALWRSTNGGESWRQVTTQVTSARWLDIAMPQGVAKSPAEQAVLATGPYCLRPLRRAKDVWISTQVDPNGANALGVIALGEVDQGGLLFVATGSGIYRSIDGGRTWQSFMEGLSTGSFVGIALANKGESKTLYALSLGGSIWKREL